MATNTEIIRSLYRITEWPLDLRHAVYQEYPFFKLGAAGSVQYYAERLAPLVYEIMADRPHYTHWVLTAPPFYRLPTAANLLCWAIYELLQTRNDTFRHVSVVNLPKPQLVLENAQDFRNYNDYSKYSWEERSALMREQQFLIKEEDFRHRGIIFIDDINVTGTKQENIRQVFADVYPDPLNWLYILDCDPLIGRRAPQLESEINNFKIKTVHDAGAILARADIRYTTKGISKIFTYSPGELEQLLAMLDQSQKSKLWAAIREEDLYQGDFFKEKMALLRARSG